MSTQRHSLTYATIMLIVILAACGAPRAPAPTDESVTIAFMMPPWWPPDFWKDLIHTFEETHPGIHVELYYRQPLDDWPQYADVALGRDVVRDEPMKRGWILDLAPLIEADEQFDADDFYPGLLRQRGPIWAIPLDIELQVLVYSPDVFHEVGAPVPGPEWTWADVVEAARLLSSKAAAGSTRYSVFGGFTLSDITVEWIAERSGGLYYREEDGDIIPGLDRPEVQKAVADWLSIRDQVTAMVNGAVFLTTEEILSHVEQGTVGMAVLPLWGVADSLSQYPGLAVAPLPPGDFVHAVYPSYALAISAGTAHPEVAWEWVRFVSRQTLGYNWPARRSVAEASGIQERMPAEVVQAALASLENQAGRLRLDPWVDGRIPIYGGITRALVFIHTPQDIADTLAVVQQEAIAAVQAWQEQQASATPVPISVSAPPSPEEGEQTIEFVLTSPSYSHEPLYTAAAEAFAKEHAEWRVMVTHAPIEKPDCLMTYVRNEGMERALARLSLNDLSPLAEPGQFPEDDFIPQAIAVMKWESRLYAVPGTIKPLVLYYNPQIFRRAGLALPTADWTVEDILTAAEQIEATTEDWGYLVTGDDVPFLLEQQGILLFTDERLPRPRFTEPEVALALERLRRLRGGGDNVFAPIVEIFPRMSSFKVGLWLNVWFDVYDYRSPLEPFGTADGPLVPGVTAIRLRPGTRLPVQVGVYGLDKEAVHPQACWEWVNFLAQQGVAPQHELPALRRLAESEATRRKLGDELFAAYMEALRQDEGTAARDTTVEDWATWWFVEAIKNAAPGDLEAALETAQSRAEAFITCLGPGGGAYLEQSQMCAQQVDPNHPLASLAP